MKLDRTGIILNTINYEACVNFYENTLGLTKIFETDSLTCFNFDASYLMVEFDNENIGTTIDSERFKTCLPLNEANVKALSDMLIKKNVKVDYQEHTWGTIVKFLEPDSNLCAFKDSKTFEKQITHFKK